MVVSNSQPSVTASRVLVNALIVIASAAITSCGTVQETTLARGHVAPIAPTPKRIDTPQANVEAKVELGESLVDKFFVVTRPAIVLQTPVIHSGVNVGRSFTMTIPSGKLVAEGVDYRGTFYVPAGTVTFSSMGGMIQVKGGVIVPNSGGQPSVFWQAPDTGEYLSDATRVFAYRLTNDEIFVSGSLKQELVYNGRSGNTVKFLYRELKDDYMRPAFTQEVTYDLNMGEVIGFKGARFKVLDASNTELKYVLIKPFD
jgi:hypothetical protein